MKRTAIALLVPLVCAALPACATEHIAPRQLVDARETLVLTHEGVAQQLDPTDLHEADVALDRAERAWRHAPDDPSTIDLAVIAQRKALLARANAGAMKAAQDARHDRAELTQLRSSRLENAQSQLKDTEQSLGRTQMQLEQEQATADAQRMKMHELESSLKDARESIAKIASVKDDDRGMVITLQGEVLFRTAKYDLKPGAMAKLDEIADALKGKEQPITVYGYTDDVGTADHNMTLSQNRAQSVADYLVSKGIPKDLVTAQGKGAGSPVAENTSVEGRAQNRRVEIVVQPKK
ncbi:MAG TPA: OmpA family protein [Polyangiaceae bacterium]|jgi:outer membrane protein OmpA-like peptidoglycan-associated protein